MRIGELSRELDTARERDESGRLLPTTGKQAKAVILRAAGISTSAAHRAERRVGEILKRMAVSGERKAQGNDVKSRGATSLADLGIPKDSY